jgi:Linalool dehydratase/isomerase
VSIDTNLPYQTALIPDRHAPDGPITTARLRRTAVLYGTLFLVGVTVAALARSSGVQAFALGLIVPGGGFLVYAAGGPLSVVTHVGLALLTVALFLLAIFAWFGSGNILAPVVVWLGSALAAGTMRHHQIWSSATTFLPGLVVASGAAGLFLRRWNLAAARERRERRNVFLADSLAVATPMDAASSLPVVEELSTEDLAAMRFLLDRGLQPVGEFNGFDWIEQFQTAAVRYQVMGLSYALSLAHFSRLPALRGYLSTAQQNLIEKMKDHRVWRYCALENAWGNLRLDPDPMAPETHDNVMYSGWYAAMIAMYASNTSDDRYDKPGAITLRHPSGHEFIYDFPSVIRILADNFARSDFCLFPCEPNWIYTICNNFAGIALKTHDRLRGTDYWSRVGPTYRRKIDDEFMTVDGRLVAIRSARTGLTIPALTSVMADAGSAFYLHPLLPEIARRSWEIVRHDLLELTDGGVKLATRGWDLIDTGNYRRSNATTVAAVMATAVEMGDSHTAHILQQLFEADHPVVTEGGVQHHPGVSVTGHVSEFNARVGRPNAMHDLVAVGIPEDWRNGPLLDQVEYPRVLVARAVSDGRAVEAVLHPGAGKGRQVVGLSQLRAGCRYRCEGTVAAEVIADAAGRTRVAVDLDGRTEIRLRPVE